VGVWVTLSCSPFPGLYSWLASCCVNPCSAVAPNHHKTTLHLSAQWHKQQQQQRTHKTHSHACVCVRLCLLMPTCAPPRSVWCVSSVCVVQVHTPHLCTAQHRVAAQERSSRAWPGQHTCSRARCRSHSRACGACTYCGRRCLCPCLCGFTHG